MRFMNSSLENLVKILPEDKLEYLSQEFTGKQLELLKQKCLKCLIKKYL